MGNSWCEQNPGKAYILWSSIASVLGVLVYYKNTRSFDEVMILIVPFIWAGMFVLGYFMDLFLKWRNNE